MRSVHFVPLALFVTLVILGCKTRQVAPQSLGAELGQTSEVEVNHGSFCYLTGKGNVMYSDSERNLSLSIRARASHDSAIWISISMLGIEAVRALVDKDSVRVLDRVSKKYKLASIDSLTALIGVPVRYDQFEALLFGLPCIRAVVKEEEETLMDWKVEHDSTRQALKLVGARVRAKDGRELLTSEYGKHVKRGGICLPHVSNFASTFSDSIKLEIDWTSLDTTSRVDMPFQIPGGYERGR